MSYFIDTNIFLRVLTGDEKKQYTESAILLKAIKNNKIEAYTSTIVIAEIVWTLSSYYKFPKQKSIQGARSVINLRGLKITDEYDHLKALYLYENYSVKYIDALIASNSKIQNKELCLVSYDTDFAKLHLLCKTPDEVIKSEEITPNNYPSN